jgi:hypothetical protein
LASSKKELLEIYNDISNGYLLLGDVSTKRNLLGENPGEAETAQDQ